MSGARAGSQALSRKSTASQGAGCLAGFFGLFLLAGLAVLVPFFILPARSVWYARDWVLTPCVVESSEVASSSDGDTHSVEVTFHYQVGDRIFRSDRYDFFSGSTSGYESKAAVVAALAPGSACTCWVNPRDPGEAVLVRRLTGEAWFALIPMLFVAVGAGGIAFALTAAVRSRRLRLAPARPRWTSAGGDREPLVLRPRRGPFGRLLVTLLVAAFWNSIVGAFLFAAYGQSEAGCMYLFLTPFVLIGLLLLAAVPYQLLTLVNPRPTLTFPAGTPRPGESVELTWRFFGWAGRIQRLTITVEAFEEVNWRQGKSTHKERSVFARVPAVEIEHGAGAIATGSTRVQLPAVAAPTFASDHARIGWVLKLRGAIPNWPDVTEEIPLPVAPALAQGERG